MNDSTWIDGFSTEVHRLAEKAFGRANFMNLQADIADRIIIFIVIVTLIVLFYLLVKRMTIKLVKLVIRHTHAVWPKVLFNNQFFRRVFALLPPLLLMLLTPIAFNGKLLGLVNQVAFVLIIYVLARMLISMIRSYYDYYLIKHEVEKTTYRGALDMAVIFVWVAAILFVIGLVFSVNLSHMMAGLSAFAAVLVLVFRDTLLGFISGVQISQNEMISIGDWIVVPDSEADGTVVDITILSVKVQNFDKTFVYVPAYHLVSRPFKNWSGVKDAGVRRINKCLWIDLTTIKTTTPELRARFEADPVVKTYLGLKKVNSLEEIEIIHEPALDTNVGLFRLWCILYLKQQPAISDDPYIIVQSGEPQAHGLPVWIYIFIKSIIWVEFEQIQSAVFEQMMVHLHEFELSQFQFSQYYLQQEQELKEEEHSKKDPNEEEIF